MPKLITTKERYLSDFNLTDEERIRVESYSRGAVRYADETHSPYKEPYDDEEASRKEDLYAALELAIETLTERQRQVVEGLLEGLNQNQIAAKLGVIQPTIYKTIYGMPYKSRVTGEVRIQGGLLKKLKFQIEELLDENVQ